MNINEKIEIIKSKLDSGYDLLKTLEYEEGIELSTRDYLEQIFNLSGELFSFLNTQKIRQKGGRNEGIIPNSFKKRV